ncbi:MAG: SDR family oxidoreductase [Planctomycetes bacterium]|nr:SDR family oxidoreductase [Planctomycetota bacterium]
MNLKGKTALVTGGARRVGRAISLELAQAGCDIAVHYGTSEEDARTLVEAVRRNGRHAVMVQGDLAESSNWAGIVAESVHSLGRLDVLVNNASVFLTERPDTIDDFDAGLWEKMVRVNLTAPAGLAHHARPHLQAHGAGRIINICDIAADRPFPSHLAYGCTKSGLVSLTKALARALAPSITVNGISPGIALFPESYDTRRRESLIAEVPLRRAGTPEDVARAVRFLAESGDFVTGQILNVDGGRSVV